jgi:hypothetical protein
MIDDAYFDEYVEEEPEPERKPDPMVLKAVPVVRKFFSRRKMPFYIGQLQCQFEKQFFHWITYKAIRELLGESFLGNTDTTIAGNAVKFVYRANLPSKTVNSHIKSAAQLLATVWDDEISKVRGKHLEALVKAELRANAFTIVGTHARSYEEEWTETDHNLDFIAELSNGQAIGLEIKNTLPYIPRSEFEIKLKMCKFLGIKPVFAVHWLPKSYIWQVYKQGGFGWLFEYQLYPLGYERLCQQLQKRLGFPVMVMTELPATPQRLFSTWVLKLKEL